MARNRKSNGQGAPFVPPNPDAMLARGAGGEHGRAPEPFDDDVGDLGPDAFEDRDPLYAERIARSTMVGDIRDAMLDEIQHGVRGRAWEQLTEAEQRDLAHRVEGRAQSVVAAALELLLADGGSSAKVTVKKVTIADNIDLQCTAARTPANLLLLGDTPGAIVMLAVADPARYGGERAPVDVQPDQPGLPIGEPAPETASPPI